MSDKHKLLDYVKENGTAVQINDNPANVEEAKRLGWKPADEEESGDGLDGMKASKLKELVAEAGGEYTNKAEAVSFLRSKSEE